MKRLALAAMFAVLPFSAFADTQKFTIKDGKLLSGAAGAPAGGGELALSDGQKLMFDASAKVVARDFAGAEKLYSEVIAGNGGSIDAYLQRGIVRRELKNIPGMEADARAAIALVNAKMQNHSQNASLYYQRALGLRLLRQFDAARKDLRTGMMIGGNAKWETDLKAIDLEEKMTSFR